VISSPKLRHAVMVRSGGRRETLSGTLKS
jgi:hypothetical protein